MTSEEKRHVDLTDPKAMRALAHPVRMALLDLLRLHGTLTATQASEALGESPANCAFHLRTLAKYGFAEEAGGGKGRERPWRGMPHELSIAAEDLDDPQAKVAAEALGRAFEERWLDRARRSLAASGALAGSWQSATGMSNKIGFLTAEELSELRDEVRAVMERFADKRRPVDRLEGSMPVEMIFLGYPITDL
jgi:DNA-binding transcriptional ArsR family regulator